MQDRTVSISFTVNALSEHNLKRHNNLVIEYDKLQVKRASPIIARVSLKEQADYATSAMHFNFNSQQYLYATILCSGRRICGLSFNIP